MKARLLALASALRARVAAIVPSVFAHVLFFAGLGAVTYGVWLIRPAAGFIVGGLLMVWVSFLVSADSPG